MPTERFSFIMPALVFQSILLEKIIVVDIVQIVVVVEDNSIDAFRTGAKPKKPKPEPLSQEKENLEPLSQEKENLEEGNYYGETEEQLDMWTTEDPL